MGALRLQLITTVSALVMLIGSRVATYSTASASLIVIVMAGILMSDLEPNINGSLDDICWT